MRPLVIFNAHFISTDDCHLQNNRIDVWEFPLDRMPPFASSFLNEAESTRANRYHFDRHKRRFTVARALLRLILGRYIQQDSKQLTFHYNEHGKPGLINSQGLEFNLSHSGDLALVAIGKRFPMGVDLEFYSARPYKGIARHLFSDQELKSFLKLPNHLKPQSFFNIWALKEAFIKACGLGLAYPTKLVTVPAFSAEDEPINDPVHHTDWLLSSFMPKPGCAAALCRHPEVKTIRYIRLANPELLF
ncbi:MAG: 4'-phosphopantetheinyl transferase superfamily protein [Tatlockia sp.]|nr:4'-phosphopantetheinyl transferase superfamily protein [Tatlockia sp.]